MGQNHARTLCHVTPSTLLAAVAIAGLSLVGSSAMALSMTVPLTVTARRPCRCASFWSDDTPRSRCKELRLSLRGGGSDSGGAGSTSVPPPLNGSGGEVVGSTGRIGSYLLRRGRGYLAAVPRGVSPGCLSPPGTPIYVSVPAASIPDVIESTLRERRDDIVLVGNGIPNRLVGEWQRKYSGGVGVGDSIEVTMAVPHFGVLTVGSDPLCSDLSPPTVAHGKHASALAALLEPDVKVEVVRTAAEANAASVRKLIWASLLWLLCHDTQGEPVDVATVHRTRPSELRLLVKDVLPAANAVLRKADDDAGGTGSDGIGPVEEVLTYMEDYSLSMPNATPSFDLARDEIGERNGILLRTGVHQPLHEDIVRRVAGSDGLERARIPPSKQHSYALPRAWDKLHSVSTGITFLVDTCTRDESMVGIQPTTPKCKDVIVVGAGIMGSALALSLARRGLNVRVFDRRPIQKGDPGETTPASWAWINANGKSPQSYHLISNLAMVAWRRDGAVSHLPQWTGSLVRRRRSVKSAPHPTHGGAYCAEGPIDRKRTLELEPSAAFLSVTRNKDLVQDEVFYFPDEGSVDPVLAVASMRDEAASLGARFVGNVNVSGLVRDDEGRVVGVTHSPHHISDSSRTDSAQESRSLSDVVIVAGGFGASFPELGGLPMLRRPGSIAFAKRELPSDDDAVLKRILVDLVDESHVLQRRDGCFVIGGGRLEVGGVGTKPTDSEESPPAASDIGIDLFEAAVGVAPRAIHGASLTHTAQGNRPMPLDGLPAVGYLEPGLYTAVTHSGVTLSPLLAELVAGEVSRGVRCHILEAYRPTRFRVP